MFQPAKIASKPRKSQNRPHNA